MQPRTTETGASTTRRDFLQGSMVAASAAVLGTSASALRPHVAGSDAIRIGMVGCGGRCTGAAVNAMTVDPGVRLVAMCDLFADRVASKREQLRTHKPDQVAVDDEHCFSGFDGYRRVIESVDVVLIANAAKFHPLHMRAALEAGKHVFVEKPHAIDPAGVKDVLAARALAEEKGLCVVSGLQSRFHRTYQETVARIHDGAIGDVLTIEENFLRAPYVLYARQPGTNEIEYQCSNQYHFAWLSGDDVPQSLIHNVDRSLWVLGEELPVKCHGLGGRSSMTDEIYGDVFDHHSVIYEFASGVKLYAFCRTTTGCYNEVSSTVVGTKGRADVTAGRIEGETRWRYSGERCNPYDEEHRALFAAIRAGETIQSGQHMAHSTLATVMGQLSCYTGEEVTWDQAASSDFFYAPKSDACAFDMTPPVELGPDGSYPVRVPGVTRLLG